MTDNQGNEQKEKISRDVAVPADTLSGIASYLLYSDALFDYCNNYRNSHDTLATPERFRLTDEEYGRFKAFVEQSDFTYDRETKSLLARLKKAARLEGTADSAQAEFQALEAKLSPNLSADLDRHKNEITRIVSTELIRRYYYAAGVAQYYMQDDKVVARAVELLNQPDEMRRLLSK